MNKLTPDVRRDVEMSIDKTIITIIDDIEGEHGTIYAKDLKIRMNRIIAIREYLIQQILDILNHK